MHIYRVLSNIASIEVMSLFLCVIINCPHCTRILHSVNVFYMVVYVLHSDMVLRKRRLVNLRAVHTCISWS